MLLDGDTTNIWQDIDLRVDPEPLCTSCHIYIIIERSRSKTPLNTNTPFKWVLMDLIQAISSKQITKDTNFANYLLIVYAYSKIPKLYGMGKITTEEVMDKLDMFEERSVKEDKFGLWDTDIIQTDDGPQFTHK